MSGIFAAALPFWLHLPEGVSSYAGKIDGLFRLILWITGIIFVLVEALLLFFLFRYRHREGRRAHYTHGNNRLEVIWTIIPAVDLRRARAAVAANLGRDQAADAGRRACRSRSLAEQFPWIIRYPGPDGKLEHRRRHRDAEPAPFPVGQGGRRDAALQGRHPLLLPAGVPRQAGRRARDVHADLVRRRCAPATGRSRAPSCAGSGTTG